ncbi:MAG: hypothetical protein ACREQM_20665 [Candidatus Dormibacteraceae bacterium]
MVDEAPAEAGHELTSMQIGLFPGARAAEAAIAKLQAAGYARSALHLRRPHQAPHPRYGLGLLVGIGGGAVLGGILGLVLGILVARAAPLVGPVTDNTDPIVIAGIFLVFGGLSGATAGGLFAMAAVADPAHFLNQELQAGRYLLGVDAPDEAAQDRAERELDEAGADDVIFMPLCETLERVFHAEPAGEPLAVQQGSLRA